MLEPMGSAPSAMTHPLSSYLRIHRKRCGFTLEEVAFLLGLESGHIIGRYEGMNRSPSLRSALACQVIFDVVPHELFPDMYEKVEKLTIERVVKLQRMLEAMSPDPTLTWKLGVLSKILKEADTRSNHV